MTSILNLDQNSHCIAGVPQSKFIVSTIKEYYKQDQASPYSIKFVTEGIEYYTINNQRFKLEQNNYLIVNQNDELETNVYSNSAVKGICIYPPSDLIQNVADFHTKTQSELLEGYNTESQFHFTQKVSRLAHSKTGQFLNQRIPAILAQAKNSQTQDFTSFYTQLAELLVQDQLEINAQLNTLSSTKKQTKEELFRRVSKAKEFILDNHKEKISIETLASISNLSKYHFLRVFKDIYQCTPYQFILELKLNAAEQLIQKGYSIIETSHIVGFSDPKNLRKALHKRQLYSN